MFDIIYSWILTQFQTNEMFSGLVGASIFASALYLAKGIPRTVYGKLERVFSYSMTVRDTSDVFYYLEEWMNKNIRDQIRDVKVCDTVEDGEPKYGIGYGTYIVWHNKKPILVSRSLNETAGKKSEETIKLRTLGRSTALMRGIIKEAIKTKNTDTTPVFIWDGWWSKYSEKERRARESLFFNAGELEEIEADLKNFVERKDWYRQKGIPYKRVYLFKGPPGTGKSSLALYLASMLDRKLYAASLSSIQNDSSLLKAFSYMHTNTGILLIEDVDSFNVVSKREEKSLTLETDGKNEVAQPKEKQEMSLSTLLNCLDGPFTPDGLVVIMTTNHPEKLDDALIRDGRVDFNKEIGYVDSTVVKKALEFFYECEVDFESEKLFIPATVQTIMLKTPDVKETIRNLLET